MGQQDQSNQAQKNRQGFDPKKIATDVKKTTFDKDDADSKQSDQSSSQKRDADTPERKDQYRTNQ